MIQKVYSKKFGAHLSLMAETCLVIFNVFKDPNKQTFNYLFSGVSNKEFFLQNDLPYLIKKVNNNCSGINIGYRDLKLEPGEHEKLKGNDIPIQFYRLTK